MTAPRIEYGAQLICTAALVYVKDFDQGIVADWIDAYGAVTPVRLVTRIWTGDAHTGWELAA